jgi:hypothetical protein
MSGPGADAQPATHRRRRRHSAKHRAAIVGIVAAVALSAAVVSAAAPTGWGPVDVLYRAGFAAVVTLASVRARRWTLIWAAALACLAAGGWAAIPAGIALAVAIALQVLHRRDRWARAAVGGTAAVALLSLQWPPVALGSAVVAAVAVAPVLATGYLRMHHRNRPYVWAGLGAAAADAHVLCARRAAVARALLARPADARGAVLGPRVRGGGVGRTRRARGGGAETPRWNLRVIKDLRAILIKSRSNS